MKPLTQGPPEAGEGTQAQPQEQAVSCPSLGAFKREMGLWQVFSSLSELWEM